jgi:hypothetical protein
VLRNDRNGLVAEEGGPAGEQLVEHRPQRVQVASRVGRAAERLLGGHVGDGAEHHALGGKSRPVQRDGKAEVPELRGPVLGEPDVAGLYVAVHDLARVRVLERVRDLRGDPDRLLHADASSLGPADQVLDRSAAHELADEVGGPVLLPDVEHRHDVRVVSEPRHRLSLASHAGEACLVKTFGFNERQRHVALEPGIARQEHALAAPFAQEALDAVAPATELAGEARCLRRRDRGSRVEARPATAAELEIPRVGSPAVRTGRLRRERRAALTAKRRVVGVRCPASGTDHGSEVCWRRRAL